MKIESVKGFVVIVGMIILSVGVWVLHSHLEAKAYNNVTGKEVSTFDAMFLELRVTND